MKDAWQLDGKPSAPALNLSLEHVLVWHEEPQVVSVLDPTGRRFLGVAVDDSEDFEVVRWVYTPVSHLEFDALICGATTVREALVADTVFVVDRRVDGGIIERAWEAKGADIPEDIRPSEDSTLPEATRARLAVQPAVPEIRIDGKRIRENLISFADLGGIVTNIQALWDALAASVFYRRTPADASLPSTLLVAGTAPGSFRISVRPAQEAVFNTISLQYRKLLDLAHDEERLRKALESHGSVVAGAFDDYMVFVGKSGLEVLTQSQKVSAFISTRRAAQAAAYVERRRQEKRKTPEPQVNLGKPFFADGYFEGYSYKTKGFTFISGEKEYTGDVEDSVLTGTPISRGLTLSSSVTYRAEIRPRQRGGRTEYTLLGFVPRDVGDKA